MIDLINIIDKFQKDNQIQSLDYNWGGELWKVIGEVAGKSFEHLTCEDFTQKLFLNFHDKLISAVNNQNENDIIKTIQLIVGEWGGIHFDDESETLQSYVEWLLDYDAAQQYSDNDLLPNHWNGISSWSKILAALKLGEYFIYDSRVAAVLQILLGKSNKIYLPLSQAKGTKNLIQKIKAKHIEKEKLTYTDYCKMLKDTGNGNHIEKQLFMLGGYLSQLSAEEQQAIIDKSLL